MKISGMERKSSGKRDSFLAQTKDAKENKKPPVKVCISKLLFNCNLILKQMVVGKHTASNWKKKVIKGQIERIKGEKQSLT